MSEDEREVLGRIVRDAWIKWANTQPGPKVNWLERWDNLPEHLKEVDRQIGEAVACYVLEQQRQAERTRHANALLLQGHEPE